MEENNSKEKDIKTAESNIWEKIAGYAYLAVIFLIPVFILPISESPIEINKAYLIFTGTAAVAILWLISFIYNGEIKVPKSAVLGMFVIISLFYLLSAVFSDNRSLSFIGDSFSLDSASAIAILSFFAIIAAFLFRGKKMPFLFIYSILISSVLIFIFQTFRIFNIIILPFDIFPAKTSNLLGSWNELGIFFGLAALLCAISLKVLNKNKIFFSLVLSISLASLVVINFKAVWEVLSIFLLVFLIYIFSNSKDTKTFASLPLAIFIISVCFLFLNSITGDILESNGLNYMEVRPSFSGTFEIIKNSLKENPVLGTGPGTFVYNWLKFKSQSVNLTQFWNIRFNYGAGIILSFFATGGALIIAAWILFFTFLAYQFFRIISIKNGEENEYAFSIIFFFAAVYLWVFNFIYAPSFVVFALAFSFTGLFIAQITEIGKIKSWNINLNSNPKIKFLSSFAVLLIIVASVGVFYVFSKKYFASYYFAEGISVFNKKGDLEKSEKFILKSVNIDPQEKAYRALTEIGIIKMQNIINNNSSSPDVLRAEFQSALSSTIKYAESAIDINNLEPVNFINLAKVFEAVIPLKIEGASNLAISNLSEALTRDPLNPDILISKARIELSMNNLKDAKSDLEKSIELKPDYAVSNFMLAQTEAADGNLENAIKKTKDTYFLAPNDIGVLFQLGLLYYQNGDYENSIQVFEKTVSMNSNYSNARYFLGLIYDKQGRKADAIGEFEKIEVLNPNNQEVKTILSNLNKGLPALETIAPPSPEKRLNPPINQTDL